MLLPHHTSISNSLLKSRFNLHFINTQLHSQSIPTTASLNIKPIILFKRNQHSFSTLPSKNHHPLLFTAKCRPQSLALPAVSHDDEENIDETVKNEIIQESQGQGKEKSFWGAVSLIIGTAVGPGMLGLPAATMKSGPLPSTIAILVSWVYVISSIILVAELSFAAMEEDGLAEVSFTGLATKALGNHFGAFVAVIYASLSFSLLVACVSGIGSIVCQWFPQMNLVLAHSLFPLAVGTVIMFFPFKAIDVSNRLLCFLMLFSITALVTIGLSVARANVLGSFTHASWSLSSILPAIPVTVLTLGFHVITPFICKIAGNSVSQARKAVLIGGAVPLIMVLSWNLIVLGLAGTTSVVSPKDPISLLLSVNPSALSAVQGFAFSALATSLIGYAVSFPKQLLDTLELIIGKRSLEKQKLYESQLVSTTDGSGRVGFVIYSGQQDHGKFGKVSFGSNDIASSKDKLFSKMTDLKSFEMLVMPLVLSAPVLIASYFPSTFSRALDFAGVYANCFLFGILPPAMAYIQQSRKRLRLSILPGGDVALALLFGIAVILGIWH
ncbi:Tryptophan/tyrosine permease [Corchorus olitorius]|uniref:Tryptophan/tyrosine permease n=1 Tax=Corchorus olitorius TaxID=93759 RepID=A0A1R3KF16_9ROSI|nr:Tryptophan/tyrosine permease [Corchorus olitorius]